MSFGFLLIAGCFIYCFGFVMGAILSSALNHEKVEKCKTTEDIIKREG